MRIAKKSFYCILKDTKCTIKSKMIGLLTQLKKGFKLLKESMNIFIQTLK